MLVAPGVTKSIVPQPWTIVQIPRYIDKTLEDEHGNNPQVEEAPVVRKVMSVSQYGRRGSSREIVSPEFLLRTETHMQLAVEDPTLYQPDDIILIFPKFDDTGTYVPGSGIAYWVDGEPNDERMGPWPSLLSVFGGTVKLRRVT